MRRRAPSWMTTWLPTNPPPLAALAAVGKIWAILLNIAQYVNPPNTSQGSVASLGFRLGLKLYCSFSILYNICCM